MLSKLLRMRYKRPIGCVKRDDDIIDTDVKNERKKMRFFKISFSFA